MNSPYAVRERPEVLRWDEHPDRPCKNDPGYADLLLVPSKHDRKDMVMACASCPVYFECLAELMTQTDYQHYGIRAGIQGLT